MTDTFSQRNQQMPRLLAATLKPLFVKRRLIDFKDEISKQQRIVRPGRPKHAVQPFFTQIASIVLRLLETIIHSPVPHALPHHLGSFLVASRQYFVS
jgi:hypothetical protein